MGSRHVEDFLLILRSPADVPPGGTLLGPEVVIRRGGPFENFTFSDAIWHPSGSTELIAISNTILILDGLAFLRDLGDKAMNKMFDFFLATHPIPIKHLQISLSSLQKPWKRIRLTQKIILYLPKNILFSLFE